MNMISLQLERDTDAGLSPRDNVGSTDPVEFLGLSFDRWSPARVRGWLDGRGANSPYAYVVTPNVDHMIRLADSPVAVRRAYEEADLKLCDSRVLARLAGMVGIDLTVVPGSDMTADLFRTGLHGGDRVCLIGGKPGDGARLEALYPGITVIQHCPPMGLRNDPMARAAAVDAAVAAQARVTLFAVGSPQQELLANEMAARPDARGTGLCIGASTDFLLGTQRRAPRLVQRLSMEWSWRLLTDPRRLAHRYLVEGPVIFPMVWHWRRARDAAHVALAKAQPKVRAA
jgi:exopolysaccharide biosynthesis WecB/TagA/CpsF family protein